MFEKWKESITHLLGQLSELDLGYPLDDHSIFDPDESLVAKNVLADRCQNLDDTLRCFYKECNGLCWPDVHNGYFLRTLQEIASPNQDGIPSTILATGEKPILVIGSTGGGELFAVDGITSEVLLLPNGAVVDGVYDNTANQVRVIGRNMFAFADRLRDDLNAFVNCRHDYTYLA